MIEVVSIFSFDTSTRTLAEREAYYLGEYVQRLRALPGLRKYVVGTTLPVPGAEVDHARVAVLYFDDLAAFAGAMATPLGMEMSRIMGEMAPASKLYVVDAQEIAA
jgi:hypothetical protein